MHIYVIIICIYTDYSCCSVTNTAHTTLSLGEMFFEVEEYGLVAGDAG